MKTYRYRIKDSTHRNWLRNKAETVNYIWNQLREFKTNFLNCFGDDLSEYDADKILKYPNIISSKTVYLVHKQYYQSCKQFKLDTLKPRDNNRTLGWIPFDKQCAVFDANTGTLTYMKRKFKVWYSQELKGKLLSGTFKKDINGKWFLTITTDYTENRICEGTKAIGIDLGISEQVVCSDGCTYKRDKFITVYEKKLAKAQRAHKKRQVSKIYTKIKNTRKDWNHKVTTDLCKKYPIIIVGDIEPRSLGKTFLAKYIYDLSAGNIKFLLTYKSIIYNTIVKIVSEKYSTVTCSSCGGKTGPSGLSGLSVRAWKCSCCGSEHNRDVNAAINILNSVMGA